MFPQLLIQLAQVSRVAVARVGGSCSKVHAWGSGILSTAALLEVFEAFKNLFYILQTHEFSLARLASRRRKVQVLLSFCFVNERNVHLGYSGVYLELLRSTRWGRIDSGPPYCVSHIH